MTDAQGCLRLWTAAFAAVEVMAQGGGAGAMKAAARTVLGLEEGAAIGAWTLAEIEKGQAARARILTYVG